MHVRVKFRGKKEAVVFRHAKATAATRAKRRAWGKKLAKMTTKAEKLRNLAKARAALRRKHR